MDQPRSEPVCDCHHKREKQVGDSFLLSFNFQCRRNDAKIDIASQHESPTYECSLFKLDGDCPYIGRKLLQKASVNKSINTAFDNEDDGGW